MRRACAFSLLLTPLLALDVGCAVENPDHVQDTTGAETGWGCSGGVCNASRTSFSAPIPDCPGEGTELLVGAGAIAILCAVSRDADELDVVHAPTCRPLACSGPIDCPQFGDREYACIESICQVADATGFGLDSVDMTALCLFDVPRHASCEEAEMDPAVMERLSGIAAVCDEGVCTGVPEGCLSP